MAPVLFPNSWPENASAIARPDREGGGSKMPGGRPPCCSPRSTEI